MWSKSSGRRTSNSKLRRFSSLSTTLLPWFLFMWCGDKSGHIVSKKIKDFTMHLYSSHHIMIWDTKIWRQEGVFSKKFVKTVVKSSIHPFSAIYLDLIYEDSNLSRCPDLTFPNHPLHLIPSQLRHIISPACTWALAGRTVCEPAYLEAIQEICLLDATLTGIQQLMISVTTKSL